MATLLLRFKHLQERRIVNNRVTLSRWQSLYGFPPGRMIGPNTRVWTEEEIDEWLASRPTAHIRNQREEPATAIELAPAKRGPGRPRKNPPQAAPQT